ncbi:MAG: Tryptophan synthase alpha chain [Labilithrix sp.]|nr:Tryptophan synthase alpha chain [Labilithrix sp.]
MDRFAVAKRSVFGKAAGWAAPIVIVVAALVASCGTERPNAAADGTENGTQPYCATPSSGCPCTEPGKIVECGKVEVVSGDYVSCSMGYRQCVGAHWSDCKGSNEVTTKALNVTPVSGGVTKQGLGGSISCSNATGPGRCIGGTDAGDGCASPAECGGGGVCAPIVGECDKGTQDGELCFDNTDCPGGSCKGITFICEDGTKDGKHCNVAADCPGGTCSPGWGVCKGGGKKGKQCKHSKKCPSGTCYQNNIYNACDPYCNTFVDTPAGLVIGGGVTVTPGGITIGGSGAPGACQKPTDSAAVYAAFPAGLRPNGGPPTTCVAGPPDTCSLDSSCAAGTCSPRAVAASGACAGADFTLGAPCWDGTRFTFQVCNRGTVAATAGFLPIGHHNGSPSVAPSTCTMATNGPAGDCLIDLTTGPLQPGQCVEFTPTQDCPLFVPNDSGDQFYFVNQSNTGLPTLPECNTCNNYTATKDTAKPPGVAGAACAAISCGGAGSGAGQPSVSTLANGFNTCAGSQDQVTSPCTAANANTNCQQDFHCDLTAGSPTVNTCVWNAKSAYSDATCNGVDLTVGAGCNNGAVYSLPVCNRGTKTLAAGSVIKVGQQNTGGFNSWSSNCAGGTTVTCSDTLTAPLAPGQCYNMLTCPGGNGQRWDIVNADNSIVECGAPGAGCKNNAAQVKDNGSGCQDCKCNSGTAEITGRIMDPAKLRPVYGVAVYVPSTAVGALAGPNVKCDTCSNIYGGLPALASATTDVDGTFRLQGVPAGVPVPLVIQLGRFRRQITVASIPACGTRALTAAQAHLPGTKTKAGDTATDTANPDLPLMAFVTGHDDATECLLARMGIATSEFTAPGGGGSIEMYTYKQVNGLTGGAGAYAPAGSTIAGIGDAGGLLGNAATLNKYNALIMPCPGNGATTSSPTSAMQTNVRNWLDAGGRLFTSHIPVQDFIYLPVGNPNQSIANWSGSPPVGNNPDGSDRDPPNSLTDNINQTFPKGAGMARWMQIAWPAPGGPGGAAPALGKLPLPNYRHDVSSVNASATSWLSGSSTGGASGAGTLQHNMVEFDAPVAGPASAQCGRAVLPLMHVSGISSGTFPGFCGAVPGALTGQELAFEYMMWEAMTCLAPSTVPPVSPPVSPIPAPAPLATVTFTRDYQAQCPVGTRVEWQFFYWQAIVPSGTDITFRAATAATAAALPAAPPPAAPATVPIAKATASTPIVPLNSWSQDAQTVAQHLTNEPPGPSQISKDYLRVYMTFNPSGGAAPVLQAWRQTYDCVPAE